MNCTEAQRQFDEMLSGRLDEPSQTLVRTHLATCTDCHREFTSLAETLAALDTLPLATPSPTLRQHFYSMLDEERDASAVTTSAIRPRVRRAVPWRWIFAPLAGGALAVVGFLAGTHYSPPAPATSMDEATKKELADLRSRVDSVGQLVGMSLFQQRSTSERLQSVLATLDKKAPDPKILSDLIGTLALDPSTNVRLSALDALYPHADQPLVRYGVLATLPREQNPLVQVAMIDFLVAARDRGAVPELERLARSEAIDRAVRDAAKRGLAQL